MKKVFNWTFSDIVSFLKKYKFSYSHTKGSHQFYVGNYNKEPRVVCVPFHGAKTFKPRTFKGIVKQSGIPLALWLK
ncbi:type II toxin-antitoxin system HicA family toxin [Patescibacteria group bacterium]|nr:type II toxin-antitoxin system HicA family toxin [Patescibacteria group bacterium]